MKFIGKVIDSIPNLSIITQIELLCWKTDNTIEKNVESFINDSLIFNINQEVINHCISLRRNKKIKTPDAIIAATALTRNYALITNNEKDFASIKDFKNSESS
ncbi:MAG: type II toxin-antitoxin system VapC family toxin [Ginsengibacter sp.]